MPTVTNHIYKNSEFLPNSMKPRYSLRVPLLGAFFLMVLSLMVLALPTLRAQQPLGFAMEAFIPANMSAKIGDTVRIPIAVRRVNAVAQQLLIDSCRFTFRFNPTVLVPLERGIFDTLYHANNLMESSITVRVNKRLRDGDVLVQIPMFVCLGDVDTTEISIDRDGQRGIPFQIFPSGMSGFTLQSVSNGLLRVENARWNGILRTVNANIGQLSMTIAPNPVQNAARIELGIGTLPPPPELGLPSLVLYATNGRDIPLAGLIDFVPMRFRGQSSLSVPVSRGIPRGTYYARFTYGPYSITRLVVFE